MNLIVTANETQVRIETRVDYNARELKAFFRALPSWLSHRVTSVRHFLYAEIPLKVVNENEFLPYGVSPVRFLWEILITAHHYAITPPSVY